MDHRIVVQLAKFLYHKYHRDAAHVRWSTQDAAVRLMYITEAEGILKAA